MNAVRTFLSQGHITRVYAGLIREVCFQGLSLHVNWTSLGHCAAAPHSPFTQNSKSLSWLTFMNTCTLLWCRRAVLSLYWLVHIAVFRKETV